MSQVMACLGWRPTPSPTFGRAREDSPVSASGLLTRCSGFPVSALRGVLVCGGKETLRRHFAVNAVVTRTPGNDDYNSRMKREMMNPYEYHHELGMYYTRITPNLIVGSQPQSASDIEKLLQDEKVGAILNLQQDKDIQYWGVDLQSIIRRCEELGIWHIRRPARDFDGDSLRVVLPRAVSALEHALEQGRTVYLHCTAGLGRAPGVAIAYLFWFNKMNLVCNLSQPDMTESHMQLDEAYLMITSKRPCGPKKDAIRGATYDLAKDDQWKEPFEELPDHAFSDVADWERQVIQDRVRSQRWT